MLLASDLGERKIIEILRENLEIPTNMIIPFGDDVSAIRVPGDLAGVLKTDMLVAKTDVPLGMSIQQAARKAVVMNISDFAAKGVRPLAVLASLGIPPSLTREEIVQLGKGLNQGATEYGTFVVGGDTNEADDLIVSCALFGLCNPDILVERSGAEIGDIVAVTGPFGNTGASFKILLEGMEPPPETREKILESIYVPRAQLELGLELAERRLISSSIDSSDGLAWCLYELSLASDLGLEIDNIPISAEARRFAEAQGLSPEDLALYGGEEYELVMTVPKDRLDEAMSIVDQKGSRIIPIGRVVEPEKGIVLKTGRKEERLAVRGWEHFSGQ
jgi:thiamine-monophosphate kinase